MECAGVSLLCRALWLCITMLCVHVCGVCCGRVHVWVCVLRGVPAGSHPARGPQNQCQKGAETRPPRTVTSSVLPTSAAAGTAGRAAHRARHSQLAQNHL